MKYEQRDVLVARHAAIKAARVTNWASSEDLRDMTQEAELTVWKVAEKAESNGYLYRAGLNAALGWWRYFVAQVKTCQAGKTGGFAFTEELDAPVPGRDRDLVKSESVFVADPEEEVEAERLVEKHRQTLRSLLLLHRWRKDSVKKAVEIMRLTIDLGYTVDGVVVETGISKRSVYAIRKRLVETLVAARDEMR